MGLGERLARRHVPTAQGRGHWGGERPTPLWEPGGGCPHPVPTLSFRQSTATPLIRVFPPALGPRGPSTFLPNCTMCQLCLGAPSAVGQTPTASRLWESCRGTL